MQIIIYTRSGIYTIKKPKMVSKVYRKYQGRQLVVYTFKADGHQKSIEVHRF